MAFDPHQHNPDENKHWTPKVGFRIYACKQCGTEKQVNTNHTGTVWAERCLGPCREITNPHTERERVGPYMGPHRYVREAY